MGDRLEDDVFELDDKIESFNDGEVLSEDGSASDSDEADFDNSEDDEAAKKQAKQAKKKRKFEEMKAKKKARLEDSSSSEAKAPSSLSLPVDQVDLVKSLAPGNAEFNFTAEDFFSFESPEKGKSYHMAAITTGMPLFRSALSELEAGSPLVVVVCSSARRAATVINTISTEAKCKIGKMFAKHFKVQDQVVALRGTFPIVVGTPNRLSKLVELGALSLSRAYVVLIDMAKDIKGYSVLNLPGVSGDLYSFLLGPVQSEKSHIQLSCVDDGSTA